MFDKDRFIEDCRAAVAEGREAQKAVREIVAEAVADPAGIARELGAPEHAGVTPLYSGPDLTAIHFVWAPYMTLLPHNHNIFAVIGIYAGREDNLFWRKLPEARPDGAQIEAAGAESLGPGQVATLGRDIIHSVANPLGKMTSTIHVYGGDFFNPPQPRSQWDHESLTEEPWDMDNTHATFRAAEARYRAGLAAGG
ncbi:MAG: hypothetical protein WDZ84_01390 [Rhodovibrionaceae bacterium]